MINKGHHIPILAITMGDPAGIGPEIAVKALARPDVYTRCKPILIGHAATMLSTLEQTGLDLRLNIIENIARASFQHGIIDLFETGRQHKNPIPPGKLSAEAGEIAFQAVKIAIELAMKGIVNGTVTGPIHKEAIHKAGHNFSGHTEIYAHFTGAKKCAVMLVDKDFSVIHATTHVSLRKACDLIKKERVLEVIQLMHEGLKKLGLVNPRIGVAGLNPHSGDGGLFGTEEVEEIQPAVAAAKKMGIDVEGPVPADALFAMAKGGKYHGCVAMYHDQGHIPFKLLGFSWDKKKQTMKRVSGVNITLGLPIVRTSVDHGTAFEIAGKGLASPQALIQAIGYAIKLLN